MYMFLIKQDRVFGILLYSIFTYNKRIIRVLRQWLNSAKWLCIIDSLIYLELYDSKIIKTVIIAIREQFANSRIYMNIFL